MNAGTHILIVDPNPTVLDIFNERPELIEEFVSIGAGSGAEALEKTRQEHYDLIVLELGLPDTDGWEVCRQMRSSGVRSPTIILTDADTVREASVLLEAGVDDYLRKPFRLNTLLSRIRIQIWQHEYSGSSKFTIGPYIFYPSDKTLLVAEESKKIRLTDKETAILRFLLRAGNRVISRDMLLDVVWGYNANVTTHTLETHIYRLRQKIELGHSNSQILVTEAGGYRLVT